MFGEAPVEIAARRVKAHAARMIGRGVVFPASRRNPSADVIRLFEHDRPHADAVQRVRRHDAGRARADHADLEVLRDAFGQRADTAVVVPPETGVVVHVIERHGHAQIGEAVLQQRFEIGVVACGLHRHVELLTRLRRARIEQPCGGFGLHEDGRMLEPVANRCARQIVRSLARRVAEKVRLPRAERFEHVALLGFAERVPLQRGLEVQLLALRSFLHAGEQRQIFTDRGAKLVAIARPVAHRLLEITSDRLRRQPRQRASEHRKRAIASERAAVLRRQIVAHGDPGGPFFTLRRRGCVGLRCRQRLARACRWRGLAGTFGASRSGSRKAGRERLRCSRRRGRLLGGNSAGRRQVRVVAGCGGTWFDLRHVVFPWLSCLYVVTA